MASGGRRRKARWGSRTRKSRKGKYLSLSRIIVKTEEVETPPAQDDARSPASPRDEEEAELKDENGGNHDAEPPFALLHHEASTLFEPLPAPSLSDILGAASSDGSASPSTSPGGVSAGGAGFPGAEVREEEEAEDLARRALRGRERWVYCRTSSSNSSSPTTTSSSSPSSSSPCSSSAASTGASARPSLLLKLDYGEILAAWADRGPLYIGHAAPKQDAQPELVDNAVQVLVAVEPAQAQHPPATACAPETVRCARAESVRRYREKRRNRLFAHRVRYEVRRVNAVKRPRFKGRFVKEHGEMEIEAT